VEAVSLANQLLGAGQLTGNQIVPLQRELGTALVALDREDLARPRRQCRPASSGGGAAT
jgi:hypothetical protein